MIQFTNTSNQPLTLAQIAQMAPAAVALQAHNSRSGRYTYIPTIDVIMGMEKAGFLPFAAMQSRTRFEDRKEFTKHMIRFRHASHVMTVGDSLSEVVLVNSHDGSSAYKLMAGIFRLVCSNGLIVADSMQDSIIVRHSGNVIDAVVEGSTRIIEAAPKMLNAVKDWSYLMLTQGEQEAFATAAHTMKFADDEGKINTPITPAQLLAPRRSADYGNDMYRTMNRIQENIIRGGVSARNPRNEDGTRGRRTTTREVKGINENIKLNKALWTLAETMAKLKSQA